MKAVAFLDRIKESQKEILLTLPGKGPNDIAACVFERGILKSYGFFEENVGTESILQNQNPVPRVPETYYILKQFIPLLKPNQIQVLDSVS